MIRFENTHRFLLAALVALANVATLLPAQTPPANSPAGKYEIKKMDGTPVVRGKKAEVEVKQLFVGVPIWVAEVTLDGEPIEGESMLITVREDGTGYEWVNNNGNEGTLDDHGGGDFKSEVTTGPHAGTERLWDRQ